MTIRPAKSDTGLPTWGSFALVTYLPDPLGSFLTELRASLCTFGEAQPDAHITFLPPRELSVPAAAAEAEIRSLLHCVEPFELELGRVRLFPQTNILYLDIKEGLDEALRLHASLNRGDLFSDEQFEYIPHLTLGGPMAPVAAAGALQQAEQAWCNSGLARCFLVEKAVLLWQSGESSDREWTRISTYELPSLAARKTFPLASRTG